MSDFSSFGQEQRKPVLWNDLCGAEMDQSAFGQNHQKAAVPFTTSKQTLLFHSRNKRCLATLMSAEAHPPYAGAHGWELSNGQTR